MRHKAKQVEINWAEPEAFALVPQKTTDGDRIAAEQTQLTTDRQAAEKLQPTLLNVTPL